jgi:hypothetical protein
MPAPGYCSLSWKSIVENPSLRQEEDENPRRIIRKRVIIFTWNKLPLLLSVKILEPS